MKNKKSLLSFIFVLLLGAVLVGCNKTTEVKTTAHVHTFNVQEANADTLKSEATCTAKATYFYKCSCGEKSTDKTFEYGELKAHTWSETYTGDENGHYHTCTVCNAKSNEEEHNYGSYVLTTLPKTEAGVKTDGVATYTCSICNHQKNVDVKIVSVSESKALEPSDDLVFVRGIVVSPLYTGTNSELLIQDETTFELTGVRGLSEQIYNSDAKALLTTTFKKGDVVEIPAHMISSTSEGVDNSKCVLSALLNAAGVEAQSCVKENGKEVKIGREYENVTVIESQDELNAFLVANKAVNTENFYKVVKLNGTLKVRTSNEGFYFTFNSDAKSDDDAKVLSYLPQFRDINMKVNLNNTAANVLGLSGATKEYTGANNTFKGEIYCLCFGGNTNYFQFYILSKDDIVDKSAGLVKTDATKHYYLTMAGNRVEEADHDFEVTGHVDATHTSIGGDVLTCKACGYSYCKNDEAKIATHLTVAEAKEAGRTIGYEAKNNKYYHYFTCTCGEQVEVEFDLASMAKDTDDKLEATCLAEGHHTYECTICGANHTVTYAIENHNVTKHDAIAATIEADGTIEYYTCSNACCEGKYYVYQNEKYVEVASIVDYFCTSHTWGTLVAAKAASCTEEGNVAYHECSYCHKYSDENYEIITNVVLNKVDHTTENHEQVLATCTENGHSAYTECSVCHEKFGYVEYQASGHGYNKAVFGYKQVKTQGSVLPGDKIILVVEDEAFTFGNVLNASGAAQKAPKVAVTITNEVLTLNDGINILTVGDYQMKASSGIQGYYSLLSSLDNVYLSSASKSVVALNSEANATKNGSSWAISFDNEGLATFQAAGTNPKGYLAYDAASGEFLCSATASKFRVFKYTITTNNDYVDEVTGSCTANGTLGHYYCDKCKKNYDLNDNLIENINVPALGHSYEVTYDWSYDFIGYEGYQVKPCAYVTVKCSRCGDLLADKVKVDAMESVEGVATELAYTKAPTCVAGTTLTLVVSYTVTINEQEVTYKDTQTHEFPALGHNFDGNMVVSLMPTTEADGTYGEVCNYCGHQNAYPIKMYDVSELKTLTPNNESDASKTIIFVRGYVLSSVSNKNNVELLIKDYTTNEIIGIVDVGSTKVGKTSNGALLMGNEEFPINRGDLLYIPVDYRTLAAGETETADDNKKVLWAHVGDLGMNWGTYNATNLDETTFDDTQGIIRGHANISFDYADSSIVTISTQAELAQFLASGGACAANAYKMVKLSGTIYGIGYYPTSGDNVEVETSVSQSFVRFYFDNTISKLDEQKIGTWSPTFSYENLYMATESANGNTYAWEIFGTANNVKLSTKYSAPAKFYGDIYCVFVGGNNLYALFDIVDTYTEVMDGDTVKSHKNPAVCPLFDEATFTAPTKTVYYLTETTADGFAIDYTGGKIVYSDTYKGTGSFKRSTYVSGVTSAATLRTKCTNEAEVLEAMKAEGTYTLNFTHNGLNYSYDVTVINKTLTSLTAPTATSVYYTEKSASGLILTGINFVANYSDSSTENVQLLASHITGTIDDGEQTLTITYNGKEVTWTVTIACDYYYVEYGVNGEENLASAPVAGNVVLIVAGTADKVIAGTDYKGNADVTITNNQIAYDASYAEFTVFAGYSSGKLSFKNEGGVQYLGSGTKEYASLYYQDKHSDASSFVLTTMEFESTQYSVLSCSKTGGDTSYIGYNSTNGFYRPYVASGSTATDVVALRIFVKYSHTAGNVAVNVNSNN